MHACREHRAVPVPRHNTARTQPGSSSTSLSQEHADDPEVILANEPTATLDPESHKKVIKPFSGFHTEGRSIVMVTHERFAAEFVER